MLIWFTAMLPKDNRLAKIRDFNLVLKQGRWFNGQFLDVKVLWLPRAQTLIEDVDNLDNFKKQLKLAVTIGIKISKSAVKRNRIKRQVVEAVRLLHKEGCLKNGYYVLVVAKRGVLDKNYAELSQEIKLLLKKSGVLITPSPTLS